MSLIHGSPYDRGSADSYYGRAPNPHYMEGYVEITDLTESQIAEYMKGYMDQERSGDRKDYGSSPRYRGTSGLTMKDFT